MTPPTHIGRILSGPAAILLPILAKTLEKELAKNSPAVLAEQILPPLLAHTNREQRLKLAVLMLLLGEGVAAAELSEIEAETIT